MYYERPRLFYLHENHANWDIFISIFQLVRRFSSREYLSTIWEPLIYNIIIYFGYIEV